LQRLAKTVIGNASLTKVWDSGRGGGNGRGTLIQPESTELDAAELLERHKAVVRQLPTGQSVRNTAKITGKVASTVQRVRAALAA